VRNLESSGGDEVLVRVRKKSWEHRNPADLAKARTQTRRRVNGVPRVGRLLALALRLEALLQERSGEGLCGSGTARRRIACARHPDHESP
jgi:hypothetical protein